MSLSTDQEKQILRERMRALRNGLPPQDVVRAGDAVTVSILDGGVLPEEGAVCLYVSVGKEVPTAGILDGLVSRGRSIAVPDWEGWQQGAGLRIVSIDGMEDLDTEGRIVPQPRRIEGRLVAVGDVRLFIVPGLAFDESGNRLGMGGGFFDRLLMLASPAAVLVGLAYDFQILARLPYEAHDIPVHRVVTPRRVISGGVYNKQEGKEDGF